LESPWSGPAQLTAHAIRSTSPIPNPARLDPNIAKAIRRERCWGISPQLALVFNPTVDWSMAQVELSPVAGDDDDDEAPQLQLTWREVDAGDDQAGVAGVGAIAGAGAGAAEAGGITGSVAGSGRSGTSPWSAGNEGLTMVAVMPSPPAAPSLLAYGGYSERGPSAAVHVFTPGWTVADAVKQVTDRPSASRRVQPRRGAPDPLMPSPR